MVALVWTYEELIGRVNMMLGFDIVEFSDKNYQLAAEFLEEVEAVVDLNYNLVMNCIEEEQEVRNYLMEDTVVGFHSNFENILDCILEVEGLYKADIEEEVVEVEVENNLILDKVSLLDNCNWIETVLLP